MSRVAPETVEAIERWVLMRLALLGWGQRKIRAEQVTENAAFAHHLERAESSDDWAAYWDATLAALPATPAPVAGQLRADERAAREQELQAMTTQDLVTEAKEHMKDYAHRWPRPSNADMALMAIDSRISAASASGAFYDQFRDDLEQQQVKILTALLEGSATDAAIFDFTAELLDRLEVGGNFRHNVHAGAKAAFAAIQRPKGKPGRKPTVRDPLFLSLVQRVEQEFNIPPERNDRGRVDGAVQLVARVMDRVFVKTHSADTGVIRHGTSLSGKAAEKVWERRNGASHEGG